MIEQLPPELNRRFMVFVPEAVPNFVLVAFESVGWCVRDYSTGELRILPSVALGRPIGELVGKPRPRGCFALWAPGVPVNDVHFWKCLTDELGRRFLGTRPSTLDLGAHGYPVLAETDFQAATGHLSPVEVERLLHSPRASDWTSWNAIQLLMAAHPNGWRNEIAKAAARLNPANRFFGLVPFQAGEPVQAAFWRAFPPSEAYDRWLRNHMIDGPRTIRDQVRAAGSTPLEAPSRVDLSFDGGKWIVFAESRIRQGAATGTQHDPRRNRIIRLADCLVNAAQGRPCALWIFTRDRSAGAECTNLVAQYRSSPEMFAAELPYHPAETLYALAERLTVWQWSDLAGALTAPQASDDLLTARVRKELRRRIRGADMASAASA